MKYRFSLFLFSAILMISLGSFYHVSACWCRSVTSCEATNRADAIFVGKVLKIETLENSESNADSMPAKKIFFQIKENLLGKKSKFLEINTGGYINDCSGFPFAKNETYLVYAGKTADSNALNVGYCGGTKKIAEADKDLGFLRKLQSGNKNGKIFGDVFGTIFNSKLNRYDDTYLVGIPLLLKGNGITKTLITNEFGNYEFSNLKAGTYYLQAFLPDYYDFDEYEREELTSEIKLNGYGCSNKDFFPDVKNTLTGMVRDSDGKPLDNIEVSLIPETKFDEEDTDNVYKTETDENGIFIFERLFPRRYVLGINIEEKDDESKDKKERRIFYPNTSNLSEATVIEFGLGQTLSGYNLYW